MKEEEKRDPFFKTDEEFMRSMQQHEEKLEVGKLPGAFLLDSRSRKQRRKLEQAEEMRKKQLKQEPSFQDEGVDFSAKIPPLVFIANKAEDGFEGDVLAEFYSKFPEVAKQVDAVTGKEVQPLFVSAEHGDGLTDLLQRIEAAIPASKHIEHRDRKAKRLERFKEYK